ncbi:hypothetical protein KQ51_01840 [Candidatus Izimaplasma bacterium HR1]|jgi:hypothetical protein|uniref:M1 family aminopeptidase n=1 Tax=Candidatus Izimoplasma sp. HR1 TaxID=1541959 RepID=UPI0004F73418|nr:hypothetical protein KQ51_01840 [Candidatus Izimaplasma bacterium HR1]
MKKILIACLLLILLTACNKDDKLYVNDNDFLAYEENQVFTENTYFLDLHLDDENFTLDVTGKLMYLVKEDTNTLNLRIYPNAGARNDVGYEVDLDYIKINGNSKSVSFDDDDETLIVVSLLEEATSGDVLEIDFGYTFDYWRGNGRISYYEDYFITMFFYPVVQLNNDEPTEDYNYAFNGESYYNTIGDYYVSINAPRAYDIASSGKKMGGVSSVYRKTSDYFLDNGRDFSFSASDKYEVYTRKINGIDFSVYSTKILNSQEVEDSFYALENAFEIYEEYVGDYPYDYFNLEYGYIYGMESTGVIYCSEDISIYTVVHEVIHQWFYSIIHNDQAREPFLDEALTTYTTFIYFYETEGMAFANGYLDYRSSMKPELVGNFNTFEGSSLMGTVHDYQQGYGYIIYYHGPTVFRYYFDEIIDGDIGVLKDFLQEYYKEYAFKEVTTIEMLELLEEVTGIVGTKDWFLEELAYLDIIEPLE